MLLTCVKTCQDKDWVKVFILACQESKHFCLEPACGSSSIRQSLLRLLWLNSGKLCV